MVAVVLNREFRHLPAVEINNTDPMIIGISNKQLFHLQAISRQVH